MNAPVQVQTPTAAPQPAAVTPSSSPAIRPASAPPFQLGMKIDDSRWLKMLVYSKHGMGKTTLLATAADVPTMRDVLFIDVEKGNLAVEDNPRISEEGRLHIINNRVAVSSSRDVSQVHDYLVGHCKHRDKTDERSTKMLAAAEANLRGISMDQITEPMRYKTVILDSLTEVEKYIMYALLGISIDKIPEIDPKDGEVDTAEWSEYKKNNQMIQLIVRTFRDLPMHFLCSAGEQYVMDEVKRQSFAPGVTGKLAAQIQGAFDIVGSLQVFADTAGNTERRLYVQPTGKYAAKNRRAVYKPDYFTNPTMLDIMKGIKLVK